MNKLVEMSSTVKKEITSVLETILLERLAELERYALDLKSSLESESKSTAGDKHDTSRAMVHLEQEKIQHQFQDLNLQLTQLNKISESTIKGTITFGALVITETDIFLLGIGMGKQLIEGKVVYCVGTESPIGKLLIGKTVGDEILFNGEIQKIVSFC